MVAPDSPWSRNGRHASARILCCVRCCSAPEGGPTCSRKPSGCGRSSSNTPASSAPISPARRTSRRSRPTWRLCWAATARSCGRPGRWAIAQVPVVAINLGKLGFLANMSPAELPEVLRDFAAGKLEVFEHLMFECTVLRNGDGAAYARQLGLNEAIVHAGTPFVLIDVDLYIDSDLVTTYSCDGLMVSTPVGSTAHCLSAGGPILRKNLQAFVVLPLSPHTLTMRPVVDSADRVYEMVVERPSEGTSVVVDGRVLCRLQPGDRVRVERADVAVQAGEQPRSYLLPRLAGETRLGRTIETQRQVGCVLARTRCGECIRHPSTLCSSPLSRKPVSERSRFSYGSAERPGSSVWLNSWLRLRSSSARASSWLVPSVRRSSPHT